LKLNINVVSIRRLPYSKRSGITYIGRQCAGWTSSPLANPFKIGVDGDREQVIAKYETWLRDLLKVPSPQHTEMIRLYHIAENSSLTLGCWCKPLPCHGDVIKKILLEAEARQQQKQQQKKAVLSAAVEDVRNGKKFWDAVADVAAQLGIDVKSAASQLSILVWKVRKEEDEARRGVQHLPGLE